MCRRWTVSILISVLALPTVAAAETRIRLENGAQPGSRVTITFSDPARAAAQLVTAADGTAQLVVEAPSPRLRLRGGSLQTDPRIDILARQQLRESSPAPARYVIESSEQPANFVVADGPLVYDDWGSWWGGSALGYGCCSTGGYGGRLRDIPVAREIPRERTRDRQPRTPVTHGTYSTRAVMPRAQRGR